MVHFLAWSLEQGVVRRNVGTWVIGPPLHTLPKPRQGRHHVHPPQPVMVAFPRCQAMHWLHVCPECLPFVPGGKIPWLTRHLPPGSDHVFTFGQHKGYTYHEVLQQYPGYYVWGRNEPGTSRILFLDWVDMYYDVDHGTHQDTPKPAPEEVQPRPAPVPGSRHKTATKKPPNPPVEISGHVCKDFSLLGSNAYVMRKTCRDCGRVTQTPKNPTYTQDPETCNHAVTDKRGSTKSTSRTFCLLCGTQVDKMSRDEGQRREALGRAVCESVRCTHGRSGRRPVEI